MATTTTKGSGVTDNDGGRIFAGGNVASSRFTNYSLITNNSGVDRMNSVAFPGKEVTQVVKGTAVTITGITESGSTGFCNIEKSSHGLSVGSKIEVYGADVAGYNRVHTVTVVTNANNVKTNVPYSASTTTHGSYKLLSGNYALQNDFIGRYICDSLAGSASSVVRMLSNSAPTRAIHMARGSRRFHITSWNAVTGAATKGANAGDLVGYIDPVGGGAVTQETIPTRAVPGEFVYRDGGKLAEYDDYNARTQ